MYAGIGCTNVTFWYKTQEILGLTAATSGQISFSWVFLRIFTGQNFAKGSF